MEVVAPQRGRRRRVLELATNDAKAVIGRDSLRRQSDHNVRSRALQELGEALGLAQPPFRIECFDMSHLQGTNYVGSMVVFEDAIAKKSDYRHFNVKEILGNDDVGAMQEVVRRRLRTWIENQATTKFRRPDLIIIDGGLPQLHAAEKAAAQAGARWPRVRRARQARGAPVPTRLVDAHRARTGFGESLPRPADPRRGSPLRHYVPSFQAREVHGRLLARRRRRSRSGAS